MEALRAEAPLHIAKTIVYASFLFFDLRSLDKPDPQSSYRPGPRTPYLWLFAFVAFYTLAKAWHVLVGTYVPAPYLVSPGCPSRHFSSRPALRLSHRTK